ADELLAAIAKQTPQRSKQDLTLEIHASKPPIGNDARRSFRPIRTLVAIYDAGWAGRRLARAHILSTIRPIPGLPVPDMRRVAETAEVMHFRFKSARDRWRRL